MSGSVALFFFNGDPTGARGRFPPRATCGSLRGTDGRRCRPLRESTRMNLKNEFTATGSDGRFYTVVRIPSSTTRGPIDADVSHSGVYSYYLTDGTRLNPVDDVRYQTANGHLTVTVDFGNG